MHVRLEVWRGHDAVERLADPAFIEQWLTLYRECSWATPFQHPAFVNTWYACYRDQGRAVVVAGFGDDSLVGLLLLAEYGGEVVGAGANQAEYQVWLALPAASKDFAPLALMAARDAAPGVPLCLKYVPCDAPAGDILEDRELARLTQVRRHPRPLMRLDPVEITGSLKKRSNASRLQRLRREGAVAVERVVDARALAPIFDEIISL